ncbi:MAG TPA: molybdopterin cofactor-binding domain-containing protein, partial [Rhizomicrobium sp.]
MTRTLTRRDFVVTAATASGGLLVGLTLPGQAAEFARQTWAEDSADPREVNAWVVIEPDESVILRCPMAEMGQGTGSGLPMLLAEELECDWSKVKVEFSSVNRNIREKKIYGDQMTAGSRGIRTSWPYVQQAGASARARLTQAAATRWNVPASECSAAMGKVAHKASGRVLTFGALVADAA